MRSNIPTFLLASVAVLGVLGLSAEASVVTNSDFEVENGEVVLGPDSWFTGGSTAYELADDSGGAGTHSAEITASSSDWRSSAFFVTPGDTIDWAIDYKFLAGTTGEFSADIRFFSGFNPGDGGTAGAFQGEQRINVSATTTGVWQTLPTNNIVVPAGALTGDIRISSGFFDAGISGGGFRVDNINVVVPEPVSASLLAVGAVVLLVRRRRA